MTDAITWAVLIAVLVVAILGLFEK